MANQPSLIPSAWAANNSTTETIPATTTESGKASWDQGFPVETSLPLSEGGIPPKYGDFNGVLNVLSQFCLFAQAGGQYAWSNTLDYSVGSIVLGTDGSIYRAAQVSGPSTAAVNPVGDTSGKWERIVSQSDINALEQEISDAMDAAEDAASNASAAQSAVTTLDANVVKLSGNQTVGGKKTFTSPIVITTTAGNATEAISASTSNGAIHINGGAGEGKGAFISLCGQDTVNDTGTFYICAKDGVNTQKNLKGKTDGTLTWDGKGFVYDSGDQSIEGIKTFAAARGTVNVKIKSKGITYNTKPSSTQADGVLKFVSNDDYDTGVVDIVRYNSGVQYLQFLAYCYNGTTPQGFRICANGTASTATWSVEPSTTNLITLGVSGSRWKEIWCNQSSLNTSSDERIKQQIANVPDAVLDAWGDINWIQYKYNDSVAEKGADNARIHNGLIAQRVDEVFNDHGLDVSKYGLFLYDAWDAEPEEKDADGKVTREAQPAGDAYGLRYTEALCMEAAYQRRRADRAEARISALERRLNEMEAVLASLMSPVGDETYAEYAEPEQEQDAEQEGEE